jgi:hypothetical protein
MSHLAMVYQHQAGESPRKPKAGHRSLGDNNLLLNDLVILLDCYVD